MDLLRNTWNIVSNVVFDWWNYLTGQRAPAHLLLEYVEVNENLSTKCINTGDTVINKNQQKNLFDDPISTIPKKYEFLFESAEY
jgi:hypothetical protein